MPRCLSQNELCAARVITVGLAVGSYLNVGCRNARDLPDRGKLIQNLDQSLLIGTCWWSQEEDTSCPL